MGLFKSATGSVGCLPVSRNSSLLTWGRAGSCTTGPAPEGGGMNMVERVSHATPGLGAKAFGKGTAASAPAAPASDKGPAATHKRLKTPATQHAFVANLAMIAL